MLQAEGANQGARRNPHRKRPTTSKGHNSQTTPRGRWSNNRTTSRTWTGWRAFPDSSTILAALPRLGNRISSQLAPLYRICTLPPPSPTAPQLLVSVRSEAEASVACAGGCDILDVKEPSRGSLGMAPLGVLAEIADRLATRSQAPPLSIALGELAEWPDDRPLPELPPGIHFVKVGVAGLTREEVADRLSRLQLRFLRMQASPSHSDTAAPPQWILATYADFQAARSPSPGDLWDIAQVQNCVGVLIDTWGKQGPGLTGCLTEDQLHTLRAGARERGLTLALAGRLTLADIPLLRRVGPDIVGIRSAACVEGNRAGALCAGALERFRTSLGAPLAPPVPGRPAGREALPLSVVTP